MSNTHSLDLAAAEQFVERNAPLDRPSPAARWDGWTMVLTFPSRLAEQSTKGVYVRKGGYWANEKRVSPDSNGRYNFVFKGSR